MYYKKEIKNQPFLTLIYFFSIKCRVLLLPWCHCSLNYLFDSYMLILISLCMVSIVIFQVISGVSYFHIIHACDVGQHFMCVNDDELEFSEMWATQK